MIKSTYTNYVFCKIVLQTNLLNIQEAKISCDLQFYIPGFVEKLTVKTKLNFFEFLNPFLLLYIIIYIYIYIHTHTYTGVHIRGGGLYPP